MVDFKVHDKETAPESAQALLDAAAKRFGFAPNLYGVMAESPQTLEGYLKLSECVGQTGLSPAEQQTIMLAVNFYNDCHYCMAAHSTIAEMSEVPADVIEALRAGEPVADARLEALRQFATKVVDKRGWLDDADIEAFLGAGYDKRAVFDVILIVGLKTISNYVNHIADTPVDAAFSKHQWESPKR